MVVNQNKKNKQIPNKMKEGLQAQLGGTIAGIPIVNQKTKDEIINRINASLTSGQ